MAIKILTVYDLLAIVDAARTNQHVLSLSDSLNLAEQKKSSPSVQTASNKIVFTENNRLRFGIKRGNFHDTITFSDKGQRTRSITILEALRFFENARTANHFDLQDVLTFNEVLTQNNGPICIDSIAFAELIKVNHRRSIAIIDTLPFVQSTYSFKLDPYYYAIPRNVLIP